MAAAEQPEAGSTSEPLVAKPSKSLWDWRGRRYILITALVLGGAWFAYDGYIGWPEQNRRHAEVRAELESAEQRGDQAEVTRLSVLLKETPHHTDMSIFLQKVLAITLPPVGLLFLIYVQYKSRGEYRLERQMLQAPGHPPVPLEAIRRLDKTEWDRKGIARIHYELPDGRGGRIVLDDFIYERKPTDAIFERVDAYVRLRLAEVEQAQVQGAKV